MGGNNVSLADLLTAELPKRLGTVGYRAKACGFTVSQFHPPWAVVRKWASCNGKGVSIVELLTVELRTATRHRGIHSEGLWLHSVRIPSTLGGCAEMGKLGWQRCFHCGAAHRRAPNRYQTPWDTERRLVASQCPNSIHLGRLCRNGQVRMATVFPLWSCLP